jgi:ABC-2 type transport system permease protein
MLWFYLTPVFYPIEMVPAKYLSFYIINPMAVFIHNYREILLQNKLMNFDYYLLATLISIIFFIISYYIFIRLERLFGEVI